MSTITANAVVKVIESRLAAGNDTTLNDINSTIAQKGYSAEEALAIAVQVGNIQLNEGVKEEDIITTVVSAYKAAAYQILQKNGIAFNSDKRLHDNLNEFFQKVRQLIKNASVQRSGGGISQLSGMGIQAGSLSVAPSSAPASAAAIEGFSGLSGGSDGGVPVPQSAPTSGLTSSAADAFSGPTAIPATTAPAPVVNNTAVKQQAAAEAARNNSPIARISEVDHLESYAEHELKTPKERITITAKEANEAVNEFLVSGNWSDGLLDVLEGKTRTVYYKGADIIVRRNTDKRTYMLNLPDDKVAVSEIERFASQHRSLLGDLEGLYGNDDPDFIIKAVTGVVNGMKKNVVELYTALLKDGSGTPSTAGEAARFTNTFIGMMSVAIHNALSLGTNRCKEIPNSPAITLERNMEDLDFFSGYLYEKSTGDNGYTTEPDFFRELFMLVANSLRKVDVILESGELSIELTNIEIVIPGNYPTLKRHNVIGKHSLGATHDPVSTIFELCGDYCPTANVYLKADENYLLLSTGEKTAPIYY